MLLSYMYHCQCITHSGGNGTTIRLMNILFCKNRQIDGSLPIQDYYLVSENFRLRPKSRVVVG